MGDSPLSGLSVTYTEPRAVVVRRLHLQLSELPRAAGENVVIERAAELEVTVHKRVTDRFVKGLDGSYVHEDLVARDSHAVRRGVECVVA